MRKLLLSISALIVFCFAAFAQDSRQRTVDTIVADVLAAMPSPDKAAFDANMADLAASAPESVMKLSALLQPADKGVNNLVEYALSGLVNYVSAPGLDGQKAKVMDGLIAAASLLDDDTAKNFIVSLQRLISPSPVDLPAKDLSIKEAKALLASDQTHLRCQSAAAYLKALPSKAPKILAKALKGSDRQYANAVLGYASEYAGVDALVSTVAKLYPALAPDAKEDVLNWVGNNKVSQLQELVNKELTSNVLGEQAGQSLAGVKTAAILAARALGGSENLSSIVSLLSDATLGSSAAHALKSFPGDVKDALLSALKETPSSNVLELVAEKQIKAAAPQVFKLLEDKDLHTSALNALSGVCSSSDAPALAALLDRAADADILPLQNALSKVAEGLGPEETFTTLSALSAKSAKPERFYSVLAKTGTDEAVAALASACKDGNKDALNALLTIDNYKAATEILNLVKGDKSLSDKLLPRYVDLVSAYESNAEKKRLAFAQALNLTENTSVKQAALSALGRVPTMKAFLLGGKYLDDPNTAYAAANCVKSIAAKSTEEIDGNAYKSILEKAAQVFGSTGNADDGYAVDEIRQLLSKAESSPISQLTDEEKAAGFEMLFDGTDLSKWQGDKEGYIPVNGTIYVSANYGATGNLYTLKKYRNFVYRFEFCFLRSGVNNGVGVRTPMGVDAAYEGMCEVQILDHDAPIYKGLQDYQVHGSVYGVVPAKRIVHKPLGEWSTEEIKVVGDHITVTVNGEVIVDTDVRKACKGHNVAPKGASENPYTVDHRNHPGMFNRDGYISFCGHGEGLKIKNVRILDLGERP